MSAPQKAAADDDQGAAPARRGPGRPRLTEAELARRRARLLDGAINAIRTLGPAASVDQLAEEMGVSKPLLYTEFGDKEGIADAVGVELARRVDAEFIAHLTKLGELDVRTGTQAVIDSLFTVLTEEESVYGFIIRSIRMSDRRLLDNGFVRALDERVQLLGSVIAPNLDGEALRLLARGALGFVVFAAESWQEDHAPSRAQLADAIEQVLGIVTARPPV